MRIRATAKEEPVSIENDVDGWQATGMVLTVFIDDETASDIVAGTVDPVDLAAALQVELARLDEG